MMSNADLRFRVSVTVQLLMTECCAVLCSSVRRGCGMLSDDMLTINVGSYVNAMEFCRITSPVVKQRPSALVRYRRIVTHDIVIMTGHSNGRIKAWDVKTGDRCCFVAFCQLKRLLRASNSLSLSSLSFHFCPCHLMQEI